MEVILEIGDIKSKTNLNTNIVYEIKMNLAQFYDFKEQIDSLLLCLNDKRQYSQTKSSNIEEQIQNIKSQIQFQDQENRSKLNNNNLESAKNFDKSNISDKSLAEEQKQSSKIKEKKNDDSQLNLKNSFISKKINTKCRGLVKNKDKNKLWNFEDEVEKSELLLDWLCTNEFGNPSGHTLLGLIFLEHLSVKMYGQLLVTSLLIGFSFIYITSYLVKKFKIVNFNGDHFGYSIDSINVSQRNTIDMEEGVGLKQLQQSKV
ncbi:hypothetical protein PPERSA_12579 [Pseudocohnilembus persalinus]|uniref:Transmembrane protein n=1 Tax=Pseudocohnilembus persalinus TaxID=266149 RepID=A0A0V0QCR2_PSEPJ|nr:hypothetical protein PPERSA_12579 [Pseudocohnilembus persalinus]|eukprot:KRW99903.1 hypothetical protein PPERSA_12579 [Pseudocohnilembus persalinus]